MPNCTPLKERCRCARPLAAHVSIDVFAFTHGPVAAYRAGPRLLRCYSRFPLSSCTPLAAAIGDRGAMFGTLDIAPSSIALNEGADHGETAILHPIGRPTVG